MNKDGKNFILAVNLEAAAEIARQIRLRNIGGLIIADFIDMKAKAGSQCGLPKNETGGRKRSGEDPPLYLFQFWHHAITRQRHSESHASNLFTGCPYCESRGKIKSVRTVTIDIQRRLLSQLK